MKELLLDEELRLTLGKKAQEKFFASFTLEQFEKKMKDTFEALM